jgi:hypothetical protein
VERKHAMEPSDSGATKANRNVSAELRMVMSRLEVKKGFHKPSVIVSERSSRRPWI